jgi:hypothetical protein
VPSIDASAIPKKSDKCKNDESCNTTNNTTRSTYSDDSFSRNQDDTTTKSGVSDDNRTRSGVSDDNFTTTQQSNNTSSKQSTDTNYTLTDTNMSNLDTTFETTEPDFKKMSNRLVSKGLFGKNQERNDDEYEEYSEKSNRDSNIVIYNSELKKKKMLCAPDDTIVSLVVSNSVLYASSSSKIFRYDSEKEIWKTTGSVERRILNIYDIDGELGIQTEQGNYILNSDKKNLTMKKTKEYNKTYLGKMIYIDETKKLLQYKNSNTNKTIADKVTCFDCDDNNLCYISGKHLNLTRNNRDNKDIKISGFGSAICLNNGNIYVYITHK